MSLTDKHLRTPHAPLTHRPVARRELSRSHLAFYRAVLEGVDARRAWDQYLQVEGDYTDSAHRSMITWVRQALIAEAMATGQPGLIGLFRRDPQRLQGDDTPTLDDFAARYADAGEFSEAELLAMWQEEYGTRASLSERRSRLSRRLRDALQLLERSTRRTPQPEDPVGQWLSPELAERLQASGLSRLRDVQQALAGRRRQRWGAVAGVGQVWADRLSHWLADVGLAPTPTEQPAPSLLQPLESLLAAEPPCPDAALVQRWLAVRGGNEHTRRAYRRAAERLLLWCRHERGVALPSLTPADGIHYRSWLRDIGALSPAAWSARGWKLPQEAWTAPRGAARDGHRWRPFAPAPARAGGSLLSAASVSQELQVLRALFRFLRDQGVATADPWPQETRAPRPDPRQRSLAPPVWCALLEAASAGHDERSLRLRAILWLGLGCGLRPAEMLSLRLGSLRRGDAHWSLTVIGRQGVVRQVPLPSPARAALIDYLAGVGVDAHSAHGDAPLLRGRRGRRRRDGSAPVSTALGYQTLHAEVKRGVQACAELLSARGDTTMAEAVRGASAHWLRHSCALGVLSSGDLDLPAVQRLLGHASMASTAAYLGQDGEMTAEGLERYISRQAVQPG